ncbi:hypothetical protein QCA50_007174 [Cerrena zonata]|uniref:Uncharacterized protein n=1 Tax=Cerrena zonata TaxID=2478898 RepID=A0AAW0GHH5_9APHY
MAFRRRDSRNPHSSADAYRSLRNPASPLDFQDQDPSPPVTHHGRLSSSEDDTMVPPTPFSPDYAHVNERTALNPATPTRSGRPVSGGDSDSGVPLSPPRPFFLGSSRTDTSDRGSWSSTATLEPVSDSDVGSSESVPRLQTVGAVRRPTVRTTSPTPAAVTTKRSSNGQTVVVGGASKAARAAMRYANASRERAGSVTSQMSTSTSGGAPPIPPPPSASLRARNQHRRRSSTADNASIVTTTSNSHQGPEKTDTLSAEPNPFDTPTSSVYVPTGVNNTPTTEAPGPVQAQETVDSHPLAACYPGRCPRCCSYARICTCTHFSSEIE